MVSFVLRLLGTLFFFYQLFKFSPQLLTEGFIQEQDCLFFVFVLILTNVSHSPHAARSSSTSVEIRKNKSFVSLPFIINVILCIKLVFFYNKRRSLLVKCWFIRMSTLFWAHKSDAHTHFSLGYTSENWSDECTLILRYSLPHCR